MKLVPFLVSMLAAALISPAALAQGKSCDELKSAIATKLDGKGVSGYVLEVVPADQDAGDKRVVGTCEGGSKKIIYSKESKPKT
ncbi:DUF1161 domain-containing protein [Ideonella sp. DXS29W]|uniref:DUF1161 domain-containing protein n=1 Tax=Ideonella lacteola TaxID=2984193 RepID=A0ABU9BYZ1_9BURK